MFQPETAAPSTRATGTAIRPLLPVLFLLLLGAAALPLLASHLPPLGAYPGMLARLYALAFLDQDPILSRLYDIRWEVAPDQLMDLIMAPLVRVFDLFAAGRLFLVAALLLPVTGAAALNWALYRRLTLAPLATFLFAYNQAFMAGLFDFTFGLGLALWGLALWVFCRHQSPLARGVVSMAVLAPLALSDPFALAAYAIALLSLEARHLAALPPRAVHRAGPEVMALLVPFVLATPLMLAGGDGELELAAPRTGTFGLAALDWLVGSTWAPLDVLVATVVLGGVSWAVSRDTLRLHPAADWVLVAGVLAMTAQVVIEPLAVATDGRAPVALVFVLIGFSRWRFHSAGGRRLFVALLLALTLVRITHVGATFLRMGGVLEDLRASFRLIEPGSAILVADSDRAHWHPDYRALSQALDQAVALAVVDRASLVPHTVTRNGRDTLVTEPQWRDLDGPPPVRPAVRDLRAVLGGQGPVPSERVYWKRWTDRFDYVYVLFTEAGYDPNPWPTRLTLMHQGKHFQLYKITRQSPPR
ncbi:MAG TPA: hypothetical protein VEB64_14855 [Azospirillaceae bacterium]|nr:hypothetical protein [Azospirillaceae bacterium]